MKILSIDTSSSKFSIAIAEYETVAKWQNQSHSESEGRRISTENRHFPFALLRIKMTKKAISQQSQYKKIVDTFESDSINQHSTELVPRISDLLKKNSLEITDIDIFCVGIGPGSFTGLRVGAATMRGFAFALQKKIAGINSIDAIAFSVLSYKMPVCAIIDAKRENVYARFYNYESETDFLKPEGEVLLYKIDELMNVIKTPIVLTGDGLAHYSSKLTDKFGSSIKISEQECWYPKSENLIKVLLDKIENNLPYADDVMALEPLYIYPKDCQVRNG